MSGFAYKGSTNGLGAPILVMSVTRFCRSKLADVFGHSAGANLLRLRPMSVVLGGAVPAISSYTMIYNHSCRAYSPTYGGL